MAESTSEAVSDITKALRQFTGSVGGLKSSSVKLSSVVESFAEALEATGSALTASETSFKKYEDSVTQSTKFLKTGSAFFVKGAGKRLVIFNLINIANEIVQTVLESNDAQVTAFDRVSKFGIGVGTTVEGLTKISNEAGFWTKNNDGLLKSYEKLGNGLTNLGSTSNSGATELGKIVTTVDDVMDSYMRLGLSQNDLTMLQTDYVSMTTMLGDKYDKSDKQYREASRKYAVSIVELSRLTGDNVSEISAKLNEQMRDNQFRLRLTLLRKTESGKKIADSYQQAELIADKFMGPETAKGVRDWLATGTATTKEGESLLLKTNGQISNWKAELDKGQITALEFNKRVGTAITTYEKTNRTSLMLSKDFQTKTDMTVKSLQGAEAINNIRNQEELKAELENFSKKEQLNADGKAGVKELQIAQFKFEQKAGIVRDKMIATIQEPVNSVLRQLAELVKTAAIGTIRLGAWLLGEQAKIDEALVALGDTTKIDSYIENLNRSIRETENQITKQEEFAIKDKENQRLLNVALEKQKKAAEKLKNIGSSDDRTKIESEAAAANNEVVRAQQALEQNRNEEKSKFGKTSGELAAQKDDLIKKKKIAEEKKTTKAKEELARTNAYDNYVTGKGVTRWDKINPDFQQKVLGMAQQYWIATGKKLNITNSYRTDEEQLDMHNAWLAAGGNKDTNPGVYTEKYGWLYVPSKTPGKHGAGLAVDISKDQLDWLENNGVLDEYGLRRHYPIEQDPVHVVPKAKKGGVFGPGLIEMHGTEAKTPLINGAISVALKDPNNMSDFSGITNTINKPQPAAPSIKEQSTSSIFAETLLDKVDQLNRKIAESNSIYSDIKLYISN